MAIYLNNTGGNIVLVSGEDAPARIYYGGGGTSGNFKPADVSRAGELNGFLIDLGGDSYSFKFDDLVINDYYPTTLEFASEALQALFSQTPYTPPPLILQYDGAGNVPYTILKDWNDFFDLPAKGIGFTSVVIDGEYVYLRGGKGITLTENLFNANIKIVKITDDAFCITSAENQVFEGCTNLADAVLPLLKTAGVGCFVDCAGISAFEKVPSLVSAGDSCFKNCTSATLFNLPLLQSAGQECFKGCTSATTFDLPSLQSAGASCFQQCSSATTFDLPVLKTAGGKCFQQCSAATSFDLPLLQSTGNGCFKGCVNVIDFILPSLQNADTQSFSACSSVIEFNLPLLQSAGNNCFQSCTSAELFDLPLLQSVGDVCFESCTSATLFNLPVLINLGQSVEDDSVFFSIIGNTIQIIILPLLMTCNSGEPDGDIVYLQENNDVTITLV